MPEVCSLPDCDRPRYQTRPMCASHYMRNWRYGDPYYVAPPRYDDKTGRRFGRLVVMKRVPGPPSMWRCRCDCGNEVTVRAGCLNAGNTTSCGQHRHKDEVSYSGAHDRVRALRGSASLHRCVDCDRPAHDWSYDHDDPEERLSEYGSFSLDPHHYQPRCVRCHRIFDEHPWMRSA